MLAPTRFCVVIKKPESHSGAVLGELPLLPGGVVFDIWYLFADKTWWCGKLPELLLQLPGGVVFDI